MKCDHDIATMSKGDKTSGARIWHIVQSLACTADGKPATNQAQVRGETV